MVELGNKKRILIVEDEAIIATNLKLRLEEMGYSVPCAVATGSDAIRKVDEDNVDLVLMDIMLKGDMDGIEVAGEIRSKYNIPVIYLTAFTEEEMLNRAKLTEPYGYLVKPVSDTEMLSAIEVALYKCTMEKKLRESEEKYSILVETAKDGVVIIQDGTYVFANKAMGHIVGYSNKELIGKSLVDTVLPEYVPMIMNRYQARLEGEQVPSTYELKVVCKNGEKKDVELSASHVRYKGSPATMGIIRDISERKRAEAELKAHREKLTELVEDRTSELSEVNRLLMQEIEERKILEKAMFETEERELRRIGYELHDGLGQILSGVSLKCRSLEKTVYEKLSSEAGTVSRITALIDEAKEHLRMLMQGHLPMEKNQQNIVSLLKELGSRTERDFNVPCVIDIEGHPEVKNKTAILHLYRIAQESVTNAVKHGSPSQISIGFSCVDGKAKLTVRDDGCGLSKNRSQAGGMGLKIMKYRANMIDGDLNISSEPMKGTSVVCYVANKSCKKNYKKSPSGLVQGAQLSHDNL